VRWFQNSLNSILSLNLPVDGVMSVEARSAVRSFQQRQGLPVTGIVGPDTQQALLAAMRGPGGVDGGDAAGDTSSAAVGDSAIDAGGDTASDAQGDQARAAGGDSDGQDQTAADALEFLSEFEFPQTELGLGSEFENWQRQLNRGYPSFYGDPQDEFEAATNAQAASDSRIIDLTAQAVKSQRKGTRDPKQVNTLVLHQMACCFKVKDPLKRFLKNFAPHFAILADGRILQLHPILALTWASNGFNGSSVAVEFAGNFPNTSGKWWVDKTELKKLTPAQAQAYLKANQNQVTAEQIEAGRYLVGYLISTMGLKRIVAHRQSSNMRENDPGPDIWYHVGQWAIDNLGLKDGGPGYKTGTGKPIPDLWRKWGQAKPQKELEFSAYESEAWESEVNRSSSNYVRWVQQALNRILGLQLTVDGDAGVKTRSAIRSFQAQRGLVVDGIVGPRTEAALLAAGAGPLPGASSRPTSAVVCNDSRTSVDCPVTTATPTEVLDDFDFGKSILKPLHTPQIDRVKSLIVSSQSSGQPIRSVLIVGHTDPVGSDNDNFALGQQRAEAVANRLCKALEDSMRGLTRQLNFNMASCGEQKQKATPKASRRVEIFLRKPVQQPMSQPPPAGRCSFRPSRHGFKFTNSFALPPAITIPLNRLGIPVGSGRHGLCGGMSFLAADLYNFQMAIPGTSTVPAIGTGLYNKLLSRLLDSLNLNVNLGAVLGMLGTPGFGIPWAMGSGFGLRALKFWVWMGLPDKGPGSTAQRTAGEIAIINPILRRGKFAVLGLVLENRSGSLAENHQVLAYCLTQKAPGNFVYSIYDPNYELRDDIRIEVQIVRGEAQVFHVVPVGSGAPTRTPIRGFFDMDYSPVRP
jgi:peptidoglycan hydrolase-like protein with peptidoglycan-binding domain